MTETINTLSEEVKLKESMDEVLSILERENGILDPSQLTTETTNTLSENGIEPEVLQVMTLKNTANIRILSALSGFNRETIEKTIEKLIELGLVIEGSRRKPAEVKMPINIDSQKNRISI